MENTNKPWVSNYPALADWLERHQARCLTQTKCGQNYIETWLFKGGGIAVLMIYPNRHGWDIYTNARTNNVHETLEDAERRLGIAGAENDPVCPDCHYEAHPGCKGA